MMISGKIYNLFKNSSIGIKLYYKILSCRWYMYSSMQVGKSWIKSLVSYVSKYPKTIQLPITYHCNFDCVMCGMKNLKNLQDFKSEELRSILSDKLYKRIKYVGVNGGEPFLKKDLEECILVLLEQLPKLSVINIISNGFLTDIILKKLSNIHSLCSKRNVTLNLSFSIDGVEDMQDFHRGCKGAWNNVNNTINEIKKNQRLYCDSLNIICTITKHNIFRISELENWAQKKGLTVTYNIATVHARIDNYDKEKDFSVFTDHESLLLAREFFYKKAIETNNPRYYGLFLFLRDHKRYSPCACQYNKWVTITPNCNISYCATHSDELGNGLEFSSYDIFNSNLSHLDYIKKKYCSSCSHYITSMNQEGWKVIREERLRQLHTL